MYAGRWLKISTALNPNKKTAIQLFLIRRRSVFGRVVYHVGSSHFFGIGIYPVSDTAGIGIFRSVLLYCKLWREHIFKFSREPFFYKIPWEILFFFKRRAKCTKRGPRPPLLRKKGGSCQFVEGLPPNICYQKN